MEVKNAVMPNEAQILAFSEPGPETPIYMVNLLKFKPHAEYADGRVSTLTGREAYEIYGAAMVEFLRESGGEIIFAGDVTHLMLGEVDELWDEVAIAMYPSRKTMLEVTSSSDFREVLVHRIAGLAGQLNIETTLGALMPLALGDDS